MDSTANTVMAYDAGKKEVAVTYLFWLGLGYTGAPRYYLKHTGTALAQTALFVAAVAMAVRVKETFNAGGMTLLAFAVLVIVIWQIVDAFLIPGMVRTHNQALAARLNATTANPLDAAKG